jgi:hypothetical protein
MSLLDPFGGGGSSAAQTSTTVSDQGQLNKGSTVFQGGSKGATKNSKYLETGSSDVSGNKGNIGGYTLGKNASLTVNNSGLDLHDVTSLLAGLTPTPAASQPAPAPVIISTPAAEPAPLDNPSGTDTAASVVSDSINKNPQVWLALAAILGVVILFYFFRKKA